MLLALNASCLSPNGATKNKNKTQLQQKLFSKLTVKSFLLFLKTDNNKKTFKENFYQIKKFKKNCSKTNNKKITQNFFYVNFNVLYFFYKQLFFFIFSNCNRVDRKKKEKKNMLGNFFTFHTMTLKLIFI